MSFLKQNSKAEAVGLVMIVAGLLTAAAFLYVRVAHDAKWAMLLVAVGWITAFTGKTIRKLASTRQQEKMHLRMAAEAKRDERAGAVADEGPRPAEAG